LRSQRISGQDYQMRGMRQRQAQEVHIDAPIGGWNTRDSIDNMEPTDAVVLDNWIPDLGYVKSRPGYELYIDITGTNDVKTLVVYEGVNAGTAPDYTRTTVRKLIAFHGSSATDITDPADPHTITTPTALTSARWNWAQFDNKLVVVNGYDGPFMYAGGDVATEWYAPGSAEFPLSGPDDVKNLVGINVFKNRTWYWEKGSQDVWYSALNAIGGVLAKFPLSRVGQFGGSLLSMETWTRDGGSGPDDFAVFIMSSGEAIIYQGSSPSTGGDWAIVGIYRIGALLDQRAAVKFGPDLFMVTDLDYVNLSEVLAGMEAKVTRTKANGALQQELAANRDQEGWEAIAWPEGRLIIFNIPQGLGKFRQHVFNYVTSAWCRFTDINAFTWCVYNNELYFGAANGCVYKMTTTAKTDAGASIQTIMQPAWTTLGLTQRKTLVGTRQFLQTNSPINVKNIFEVDFKPFRNQQPPLAVEEVGTPWGSPWGSPWSAADKTLANWEVIQGYGTVGGMKQYLNLKQAVKFLGMTWLYKIGERL
jgi:hypothetical protein